MRSIKLRAGLDVGGFGLWQHVFFFFFCIFALVVLQKYGIRGSFLLHAQLQILSLNTIRHLYQCFASLFR